MILRIEQQDKSYIKLSPYKQDKSYIKLSPYK